MLRDQQHNATLHEAVIVGGLTVIGFATGNGPLFAMAAAIAGNWATALAQRGFHHWCDGWFTEHGALNHDIAAALCRAFSEAVRELEHDWQGPEQQHYQFLKRKDPAAAKLTLDALRGLGTKSVDFLGQTDRLAAALHDRQATPFLRADEASTHRL